MKPSVRSADRIAAFKRKKASGILDRAYLFAALALTPLVVRNGYMDITETKTLFFVIVSGLYLVGRAICFLQFRADGERPYFPREMGDGAAAAFCLISLMASLSCGSFRDSMLGNMGRWQGTAIFFLYGLLFYAFYRRDIREKDVHLPLLMALGVTALLAVVNHLGGDPLGIQRQLGGFDRGRYISTLGNINFAGAFFSLTLPAAAWILLNTDDPAKRWGLGAVCVTGLWGAMAVRSECALLGIGAGTAILPFLLHRKPAAVRRWGLMLPGMMLAMQLYRGVTWMAGGWLSGLTETLMHPLISGAIAAAGFAWYGILRRKEGGERTALRIYGFAAALLLCAFSAALILLNTEWSHIDLGQAEHWLRFSDAWGTDRMGVWRHCLGFYSRFDLWGKLFGGGCGIIAVMDSANRIFPDAVLDAAHCEYLQILINWGALGLAAYLCWLISTIVCALRRGGALSLAICTGLIAYSVQAAVNIAQAPGVVLFFLLLSVARADTGYIPWDRGK